MSSNCTQRKETLQYRIIQVSFLSLILFVAVLLNVKTFFIIMKQKRESRKAVTIFLLNMTLVSGLMALLLIPFNIHAIIDQDWVFGDTFCKINGFTSVFLCADLTFTLLCLTIDRYFSVIKPLRHRLLMTKRSACRMLVAVHFLALLLALIPVTGELSYKYHPGTNHCSPTWRRSCVYYFVMSFLGFVIPILGMLVTYVMIIFRVRANRRLINNWQSSERSASRKSAPQESNTRVETASESPHVSHAITGAAITSSAFQGVDRKSPNDEVSQSGTRLTRRRLAVSSVISPVQQHTRAPHEHKVARTGLILVLTFTILWMPYLVVHSCIGVTCRSPTFFHVAMLLVHLNAVANPVIYALTNRSVIQGFRAHFR